MTDTITQPVNPGVFPEASVRADRLTPEAIDRRILVTTASGTTLMGVLTYYTITVARDRLAGWMRDEIRVIYVSSVAVKLEGIEDDVVIPGDSEVKVLA